MATEQQQQQPHFLLIPYTEQGHINPMLSLASHLLRLRCRVTFVKADRHFPPASPSADADADTAAAGAQSEAAASPNPSAVHESLRFVTLPVRNKAFCVDLKTMTRHQIFKNTLAGLEDRQDLVAEIVEESKASAYPITGIICDFSLWKWVRYIARAHHLRSALLYGCSALVFYAVHLMANGKDEELEELLVFRFGMPSPNDESAYLGLVGVKDSPEMKMQKRKVFYSLFEGIEECRTILINSFEALEAPLLPSLKALGLDVKFIGPCLPEWWNDDVDTGNNLAQQAGSIFKEDTTCLTWLDQQERSSVLFVSFGSEGEIEGKQFEEIALGIKNSGYRFLWVLGSNVLASSREKNRFHEQSNGQAYGMFVSWAPQKRVLKHKAVGGFLTHAGWNSTLESLTFGVPMLCLPFHADQPYNANFVQNYLQVGIHLSANKDGLVHREGVTGGVKAIMQGRFSYKVAQVKELSQSAIEVAHFNLNAFVQNTN